MSDNLVQKQMSDLSARKERLANAIKVWHNLETGFNSVDLRIRVKALEELSMASYRLMKFLDVGKDMYLCHECDTCPGATHLFSKKHICNRCGKVALCAVHNSDSTPKKRKLLWICRECDDCKVVHDYGVSMACDRCKRGTNCYPHTHRDYKDGRVGLDPYVHKQEKTKQTDKPLLLCEKCDHCADKYPKIPTSFHRPNKTGQCSECNTLGDCYPH